MSSLPKTIKRWCLFCIYSVEEDAAEHDDTVRRKEKLVTLCQIMDVSIELPETCTRSQFPCCSDCNSRIKRLWKLEQSQEKTDRIKRKIKSIKDKMIEDLTVKKVVGFMKSSQDRMSGLESFIALPKAIIRVAREKAKNEEMILRQKTLAEMKPKAVDEQNEGVGETGGNCSPSNSTTTTDWLPIITNVEGANNSSTEVAASEEPQVRSIEQTFVEEVFNGTVKSMEATGLPTDADSAKEMESDDDDLAVIDEPRKKARRTTKFYTPWLNGIRMECKSDATTGKKYWECTRCTQKFTVPPRTGGKGSAKAFLACRTHIDEIHKWKVAPSKRSASITDDKKSNNEEDEGQGCSSSSAGMPGANRNKHSK